MDEEAALRRLRFLDLVLHDLAVEIAMFVNRRADAGDEETFVIQTGEDGRFRVQLPDMSDPQDLEFRIAEAQEYLSTRAGRGVPRCVVKNHAHALRFRAVPDLGCWSCPAGEWTCPVGEYEERSWPQVGVSLAPLLVQRLARRGLRGRWRRLGVRDTPSGPVAEVSVSHRTDALVASLAAAAAPLRVDVHEVEGPPPHRV